MHNDVAHANGATLERFHVGYDARLVEESVLLAEKRLGPAEAAAFRAERDRLYEVAEPDEREARFEELHGRYFVRLGLDRPLHELLAERPAILAQAGGCRVQPAVSPRDESADARDEIGRSDARPTIVVCVRPQTLVDPGALCALLCRELLHVADVLDPGFGRAPDLPRGDADPALANLRRERYRVVWSATVDGRLCREGRLPEAVRARRLAEFARAFPMLGDRVEPEFGRWFDEERPSHAGMLAFVERVGALAC